MAARRRRARSLRTTTFLTLLFACDPACEPDGADPDGSIPIDADVPLDVGTAPDAAAADAGVSDLGIDTDGGAHEVDAGPSCAATCMTTDPCTVASCEDGACVVSTAADGTACGEPDDRVCVAGGCVRRQCGDGYREPGPMPAREGCDDGNEFDGDLCSSTCQPTEVIGAASTVPSRDLAIFPLVSWIATDGAGRALAVWAENDDGVDAVRGRLFDRLTGDQVGPIDLSVGWATRPSVAGLAGGGFAVAYYDALAEDLALRVVDPTGTPGAERGVSGSSSGYAREPHLASLDDGFVATWVEQVPLGGGMLPHIRARRFSSAGRPIDLADIDVAIPMDGPQGSARVVASGATWAVVWVDDQAGAMERVAVRRFMGDSPIDAEPLYLTAPGDPVSMPWVTPLTPPEESADGSFLVTWRREGAPDVAGTYASEVSPGQPPTTPMLIVAGTEAVSAPLPSETAPDGSVTRHFLTAYRNDPVMGANIVATRTLPPEAADLMNVLSTVEGSLSVAAAPRGLYFAFVRSTPDGFYRGAQSVYFLPTD